jgi:hypothetical protein
MKKKDSPCDACWNDKNMIAPCKESSKKKAKKKGICPFFTKGID